jgi:hypothetical protein
MSYLTSLIKLLTIVRQKPMKIMVNEILRDVVTLIVLSVVGGVLGGAVIVAGLYYIDAAFVYYGMTEEGASALVFFMAFLIIGGIATAIARSARRLYSIPTQVVTGEKRIADRISEVGVEFFKGFMDKSQAAYKQNNKLPRS